MPCGSNPNNPRHVGPMPGGSNQDDLVALAARAGMSPAAFGAFQAQLGGLSARLPGPVPAPSINGPTGEEFTLAAPPPPSVTAVPAASELTAAASDMGVAGPGPAYIPPSVTPGPFPCYTIGQATVCFENPCNESPETLRFASTPLSDWEPGSPQRTASSTICVAALQCIPLLWDESGHFYTTYLVARAAGMDKEAAFKVAYYSQLPDEVDRFDALQVSMKDPAGVMKEGTWSNQIAVYLHSLHGGDEKKIRKVRTGLKEMIQQELKSVTDKAKKADGKFNDQELWKLGFLIHAYGDSYAHVQTTSYGELAYCVPFGHLVESLPLMGASPDTIFRNLGRYQVFTKVLNEALGGPPLNENEKLQSIQNEARKKWAEETSASEVIGLTRKFAQKEGFDYDSKYDPEGPNKLWNEKGFETPAEKDVEELLKEIKKRT
jgi:hypothetical protein